jgi:hypothetical protein
MPLALASATGARIVASAAEGNFRRTSPYGEQSMRAIIIEGVLLVVLVATSAALFYYVVFYFTPLGLRFRQHLNRRRIERAADLACPIHGPRSKEQLVRLASGEAVCPDCYKESIHG